MRTDYTNADSGRATASIRTPIDGRASIDAAGTGPVPTDTDRLGCNSGATTTPTLTLALFMSALPLRRASPSTPGQRSVVRGTVQTTGLTDSRLRRVTAGDFGPIADGASTGPYTVTFSATAAGISR